MPYYLQKHLGIPSSQISNLRDSEATRTAIINEIRAFSTNSYIKKGDPILIYHAGHGAGSTGKIELLVPYDYSRLEDDRDSDHHKDGIPDRTLGTLLEHLARKKGGNIFCLNCCYSSSGTRHYIRDDPTELVRDIDVGNIPSDLDQDVWSGFDLKNVERGSQVHSGFARRGLRSHVWQQVAPRNLHMSEPAEECLPWHCSRLLETSESTSSHMPACSNRCHIYLTGESKFRLNHSIPKSG
jgi:hypothetical protein